MKKERQNQAKKKKNLDQYLSKIFLLLSSF